MEDKMPVKAVILAGGLGTRLRPLTFTIPKPLLPVGDKSILEFIVDRFKMSGIRDIVLSVGYQSNLIRAYCGDGSKLGVIFDYIEEPKPLGPAGPLSLLKGMIDPGQTILLINGDIVTFLDFPKLIHYHEQNGYDFTTCYRQIEHVSLFGVLKLKNDEVIDIQEKPKSIFNVSAGIYVLNAKVIDMIPENTFFTIPELIMKMIGNKIRVGAFQVHEFWQGIEHFTHFDEAMSALDRLGNDNAAKKT